MTRIGASTIVAAMILAACGGLPDVGDAVDGGNPFEDFEDAFDPEPVDISGLGDPPSAEPGTAVAEFDSVSAVYHMAGAVHPRCEVTDERFQVSMEDTDGNLFIFDGTPSDGSETGWQGSPAFDVDGLHHEGDSLSGHVNVDGDVITYQGTITIFHDRSDINSWEDTLGSVTANCSRPNGLPSATIAGQTFEIPVSGADTFECEFSDERFNFDVVFRTRDKYPAGNDTERITIEGRLEGDRWIGGIAVELGPDEYRGFIPEDLAGMEVGPNGASWSGTLTRTNAADDSVEEDVEVSISYVC